MRSVLVFLAMLATVLSAADLPVTVTSPASTTNASVITFTVGSATSATWIAGSPATGVTVSGGTLGTPTPANNDPVTLWTFPVTPTGDGPVTLTVPINALIAGADTNATARQTTVTSDRTAPTLGLTAFKNPVKSGDTVRFTITGSEVLMSDDTSKIAVMSGGGAVASTLSPTGSTRTIDVTAAVTNDVTCTLSSGVFKDAAGNIATPSPLSSTITYDGTVPTLTITPNGGSVNSLTGFSVTATEPIALDASKITVVGANEGGISGSGSSFSVAVSSPSQGTVSIQFEAGAATDVAGNGSPATTVSLTYDSVGPTLTAGPLFVRSASPTIVYTASEPLSASVDLSKITIDPAHPGGIASVGSATVSGDSLLITLDEVSTDVGVIIAAGAVTDALGNASAAVVSKLYVLDFAPPSFTLEAPGSVTNQRTVQVRLRAGEPVSLSTSTIFVTGGTKGLLTSANGNRDWTLPVTMIADTTVVDVRTGSITDAAGNASLDLGAAGSVTIAVDNVIPYLQASTPVTMAWVTKDLTSINLEFNEPGTLNPAKVTVSGATKGAITGSGTDWTIPLSSLPANGSITVSFADKYFVDQAGNSSTTASLILQVDSGLDNFRVERTSLGIDDLKLDGSLTIAYLADEDFALPGNVASLIGFVPGQDGGVQLHPEWAQIDPGNPRRIQIPLTSVGDQPFQIAALAGFAEDIHGNPSPALSSTFSVSLVRPTASLSLAKTTVPRAEAMAGVGMTITLSSPKGPIGSFTSAAFDAPPGSVTFGLLLGALSNVRTTKVHVIGSVTQVSIGMYPARIIDAAGNIPASIEPVVLTIDDDAPDIVSLDEAGRSLTSAFTGWTLRLDSPASLTTASLINLITTGGATIGTPTKVDDQTWRVPLTGIQPGSLSIAFKTGVFADNAGNPSPAAGPFTATYDTVGPIISYGSATSVPANSLTLAFTITDSTAGLGARNDAKIRLLPTGSKGTVTVGSSSATSATIMIPVTDAAGSFTIAFDPGFYTDVVGNSSITTSFAFTVDKTAPRITGPSSVYTNQPDWTLTLAVDNDEKIFISPSMLDAPSGVTAQAFHVDEVWKVQLNNLPLLPNTVEGNKTGVITIPAASVTDVAGNQMAAPGTITVTYDITTPTLASHVPEDGARLGSVSSATLTFSEPVTLDASKILVTNATRGTPSGVDRNWTIPLSGANGTVSMSFLDGAVKDRAGNSMPETSFGWTMITADSSPRISKVAQVGSGAPTDRTDYVTGNTLRIDVHFDQPIRVTGSGTMSLALAMNTGGSESTARLATLAAVPGSGTVSFLTFTYVIDRLDFANDLDYLSVNSFSLTGYEVKNAAGVSAVFTLPDPGSDMSLKGTSWVVVNNNVPFEPPKPFTPGDPGSAAGCGSGSAIAVMLGGLYLITRRRRRAG